MQNIIEVFTETARRYPDRIAVEDCEGQLTYRQLDERSNIVAHSIHSQCVLIILPRRSSFLVATFATLKAGSCYVGCNPDYPADRIRYIAEDSGAATLITIAAIWEQRKDELSDLVNDDSSLILIDKTHWSAPATSPSPAESAPTSVESTTLEAAVPVASPTGCPCTPVNKTTWDQEAFMLYTSGTTGKPKGVVHTIRSMTRILQPFAEWDAKRTTPVREAVFGDMAFAASLPDLFAPCFTGGTVCIIDEETRMDLNKMAAFINDRHINRIFMGSSLGVAMMKQYDLHVDQMLLGGEKVTGVTPDMVEHTDLINYYGSSEGFPLAMHHITGHEDVIPVGTQCDGDIIYILDPQMQPVPQGQMGEIYYSSDRIAKCYKNLPELSAERFLDDPFRPGWKMLRICDLGYFDANGELIHCGRADNMFKIHGQRVEPGEVENVAQQFPGMGDCVCCKKEVNGDEVICLFFEAAAPSASSAPSASAAVPSASAEGKIDTAALRAFMARQLTHYMMPEFLIQLEKLPRNARGKLDRKAMPEPQRDTPLLMIAPETSDERTLFAIAANLLGTDQFGVTDNLFTLGMTSMKAMQLVAEASRKGVQLKVNDLIKHKTIRDTLQNNMMMVKFYSDYDPSKDVAIFMTGIMIASDIEKKLEMLAERYNVLVVEAIQEHYKYIFQDEPMSEVVELYYALIDLFVPAEARIPLVTGMSYGGKLSYFIASMLSERRGQKPAVIMGDTLLFIDPRFEHLILNGELDAYVERGILPADVFNPSFRERITITTLVDSRGLTIPRYDGCVILVDDATGTNPIRFGDNVATWRRYVPQLEVVPMSFAHDTICCDNEQTLPMWKQLYNENY